LLAQPFVCAVPPDTPLDPNGVKVIPSAGPYTTASYTPGAGVVLIRNPNYHGDRPHRFARIEVAMHVPGGQAVSQVERGISDYAANGEVSAAQASRLEARFGLRSPAAKADRQQYFVYTEPELSFFVLNTHRRLFAHERLREAVNYALDRKAVARLGDMQSSMPDVPSDDYLPPGVPGHHEVSTYPEIPDLTKARQLARGFAGSTVVLYTCDQLECRAQAQVVKTDLAAIGLRVVVRSLAIAALFSRYAAPNEPFDMGLDTWGADYPDPDDFLNLLLEGGGGIPAFADPRVRRQLVADAQLSGVDRYLAYARLDQQLISKRAPWAVYGDSLSHVLFSARIGCQVNSPFYGIDIAALCVRKPPRVGRRPTAGVTRRSG
jgi:peptide/nickel transport system substrate-binding protein